MVAIEKAGYARRLGGVTIPADSGRDMRVSLLPARPIPVQESFNIPDFQRRQAGRSVMKDPFYTREDIQKMGIEWIFDLVRVGGMDQYDAGCAVIVNGGPGSTSLDALTVDDVESVEIFGATRFTRPKSANTGLKKIPRRPDGQDRMTAISNTYQAALLNEGKNCPIVYAWLR